MVADSLEESHCVWLQPELRVFWQMLTVSFHASTSLSASHHLDIYRKRCMLASKALWRWYTLFLSAHFCRLRFSLPARQQDTTLQRSHGLRWPLLNTFTSTHGMWQATEEASAEGSRCSTVTPIRLVPLIWLCSTVLRIRRMT